MDSRSLLMLAARHGQIRPLKEHPVNRLSRSACGLFFVLGSSLPIVAAGCTSRAGGAEDDVGVASEAVTKDDSTKKVEICHKGQTLSVGQPAISAHLAHGDKLGACPQACAPDTCDDGDLCTS